MKRLSSALDYAVAFGLFIFFFDQEAMAQTVDWFGNRRGYYEPPSTISWRLLIIALSGGAGFGLGWFLSPQAKEFRLSVIGFLAFLLGLIVLLDNGVWGWGLVPLLSIAAFIPSSII